MPVSALREPNMTRRDAIFTGAAILVILVYSIHEMWLEEKFTLDSCYIMY